MKLVFLDQAKDDLADIALYITKKSGSKYTGRNFAKKVIARCNELATLPYEMGITRDEIRPELRSFPFGNYVIFFQYKDDKLEIISIIEGHRDLDHILRSLQ